MTLRSAAVSARGFSLLEVLVATAVLAMAVTVLMQLFSAGLISVSRSGNVLGASAAAGRVLQESLIMFPPGRPGSGGTTDTEDGYRFETSVRPVHEDVTAESPVVLYEVSVTARASSEKEEQGFTLTTIAVSTRETAPYAPAAAR